MDASAHTPNEGERDCLFCEVGGHGWRFLFHIYFVGWEKDRIFAL